MVNFICYLCVSIYYSVIGSYSYYFKLFLPFDLQTRGPPESPLQASIFPFKYPAHIIPGLILLVPNTSFLLHTLSATNGTVAALSELDGLALSAEIYKMFSIFF